MIIAGAVFFSYIVVLILYYKSKIWYLHTWRLFFVLLLPFFGMVIAAQARSFSGCSEYKKFKSDYCVEKSEQPNINLEEIVFLTEFLSYLLFTYVSIPAFLLLVVTKAFGYMERKGAEVSEKAPDNHVQSDNTGSS